MRTDTFISRPILSTVLALVVVIAGAIAIPTLPIARFPELAPPSVTVMAIYTGANAQAVESAVTTPLEQAINGVEGLAYLQSSSTNSGICTITATFDINRNPDLAAIDVQNRVNQALGRMPADVRTNGITVTKNTAGFMGGLGFFSKDNRYDAQFISNYLDRYVRDAVKRVPGVGDVIIFGERRYAMRLWLDPGKLAARGLTAGDVTSALREQNVQVAAGALGDAPAAADQMFNLSVRAQGRLTEAAEFGDVVVSGGKDGALVRVRDIGRVELGAENYASNLRFLGLEASGMGIQLLPTANAIAVYDGVMAEMARIQKSFPPGLEWRLAFDNVVVVRESIVEVLKTLAEALVLVVLVMFLFLQNWRSTIIPALTIPVSLIGTFAFVKLFGFSINTLTLFGIVLAIGIVVDDAIVVVENIERHMREFKKSAFQAAVDAMREVLSAVIVIGIVLVAVFVPVAFFPGTTGRLYQQFSLTIAFAVVLSVFNAITLTPALAALLLDKEAHAHGWFFTRVNRVIDAGTRGYVRVVRRALAWKWAMLLVFALGLWATWAVSKAVPTAFVPEEDEGYFITIVQAPPGASLEYTDNVAKQAEKILYADPDIAAAFSVMGFSFSGAAPNNGLIFTSLKSYGERKRPDQALSAVLNRLRGPLFGISGAIVVPFAPPAIQGLSVFGGFQFEVLDQTGGDIGGLADATNVVVGAGNQSGRVAGLFSSFRANDPQLRVDIDRDKARALGLPMREVTDALQVFLGSQYVNDFDFNNRAYRVFVQADQRFRAAPQDLKQLYARAANGRMVSLDTVVRVSEVTAPQVISHFNLFRSSEITGVAAPGLSSGEALAAMENVARTSLPPGFDFAWAGQSLEEIKAGSQAVYIFALSVLLVYLVLAAQYESWVLPIIILLGVPLAVLGGLGAQLVRGLANDVFCQVGLVLLVGLAAKNAILIVEFAEQLRETGLDITEAAVEAARIRLRPILMTSIAFILGVLPLAYATGAGAAARNSVGTTVAGGMLASTFLSIVFIPVLYVVIRTLVPGEPRHSHAHPTEEVAGA
ncbi:MAG: multidrug efflux RND transporter permease subunit [Acidobacteriota bacterium]